MRLIKLELKSDSFPEPVYVNPYHITSIHRFNEGTCISYVGDMKHSITVKETPEQIMSMLGMHEHQPGVYYGNAGYKSYHQF